MALAIYHCVYLAFKPGVYSWGFVLFWDSRKQSKWRQMEQVSFFSFYCTNKADTDRRNQGTKRFKNQGFLKQGSGLHYSKQNRSNGWMYTRALPLTRSSGSHGCVPRVMAVGFLSEGYYRHWVDAAWGRTSVLLCVNGSVPHTNSSAPLRLSNVPSDIYAGPTVCLRDTTLGFSETNCNLSCLIIIKLKWSRPSLHHRQIRGVAGFAVS